MTLSNRKINSNLEIEKCKPYSKEFANAGRSLENRNISLKADFKLSKDFVEYEDGYQSTYSDLDQHKNSHYKVPFYGSRFSKMELDYIAETAINKMIKSVDPADWSFFSELIFVDVAYQYNEIEYEYLSLAVKRLMQEKIVKIKYEEAEQNNQVDKKINKKELNRSGILDFFLVSSLSWFILWIILSNIFLMIWTLNHYS